MSLNPTFESLFFATDEPLTLKRIAEVVSDVPATELEEAFGKWKESLSEDEERGLQVVEVAGGFLLATKPAYNEAVDKLLERRKKRSLSQAALETLAIIAYREPITRAEIEAVRGVNVDSMVHTLLQRRLIKISGRKDVPGTPFLYKTTKQFLHHFGLRSLKELPQIDELSQALADAEEEYNEEFDFPAPDELGVEMDSPQAEQEAVEEPAETG
jgi:segregation and condensation protein B